MSADPPPPPPPPPPHQHQLHHFLLLHPNTSLLHHRLLHNPPPPDDPLPPPPTSAASSSTPPSSSHAKIGSSPSWRRRQAFAAVPSAIDPAVPSLLKTTLTLCRDLGSSRLKLPQICQRRNAAAVCRRSSALSALFEELLLVSAGGSAGIPPSALRCFADLREILGRAKALIHYCRHSSNLLLLLMEHDAVSEQFRQISLRLSAALAPLPFELLQISSDVQDQVRHVQRHSAIAASLDDDREAALRREIESTLAALEEDEREGADEAKLRLIFDGLGFREAADCDRELKKMEAEKEKMRQQQSFEKIPEINNLMSFVRYARCILYGLAADANISVAAAACRRIDPSASRKTVVLNGSGGVGSVPEDFRCPISLEIMVDPVVAASGHSYERAEIERWLADGRATCPKTGAALLHRHLTPNAALRRLIAQWCAENDFVLDDVEGGASAQERHRVDTLPASRAAMEATRLTAAFLAERISAEGASAAVQRQAAHELRLMAKEGMDNRRSVASAGAIPALVGLLRRVSDAEAQEHAVTALLNLSISDANKKAIMETPGSVAAIVGVLAGGASVEARENAAAALFSLTAPRENRSLIGAEAGAIDGLLAVMRGGSCERARRDAAATLFNIALDAELAAEMKRKGAMRAAMEAVKAGDDDAVSLLAVLVRRGGNEEGGELCAGMAEVAKALVAAAAGGGNARVQEHALSLLVTACSFGEAPATVEALKRRLVAETALVAALRRMRFGGTPRAQRKAASLLKILQHQSSVDFLSRRGGYPRSTININTTTNTTTNVNINI